LLFGKTKGGIGVLGAMPPEIINLKASSIDIEMFTTSSSGTIAYQPVVGFGVVIKTLSIGRARWD